MNTCPICYKQFPDSIRVCPNDGVGLISPDSKTIDARSLAQQDPLIGKCIADRFQILGKLGQGGMGAVYQAKHTKMNRMCAIKIMNAQIANDPEAMARFNREAQMSSQLNHPHAVTIYDFGEAEGGLVYLAMEYVEGETLSKVLAKRGPLPLDMVLNIARQAGSAIEAAHRMLIIHRDLKPDNIMLTKNNGQDWIKVLDFGIAKTTDDQRHVTQTGMTIGTPAYMSPEQAAGDKLDARSDLYSFVLIVYEMLTGALPFRGENSQAIMVKRLTDPPMPLQVANPNVRVHPQIEAVIMQGLARVRDYRPPSVEQFVRNFEMAMAQSAGQQQFFQPGPQTLPHTAPGRTAPPPPHFGTNPATPPQAQPGRPPMGQPPMGQPPMPPQGRPPSGYAQPPQPPPGFSSSGPTVPANAPGAPPSLMKPPTNPPGNMPPMNTPGMPIPGQRPLAGNSLAPQNTPGNLPTVPYPQGPAVQSGPNMPHPQGPPMPPTNMPPTANGRSNVGLIIGVIVIVIVLGIGALLLLAALSNADGQSTQNTPGDSSSSGSGESGTSPSGSNKDKKKDKVKKETVAPVADLSGEWILTNTIEHTSYSAYEGLRLGYRIYLQQDGNSLKGNGEKRWENGVEISSPTARTPIYLEGTISGDSVTLNITEVGAKRTTAGQITLTVHPETNTLDGRFSSNAADSSGAAYIEKNSNTY
ncbi:MAG TPA: protein kinase [Acidobacteriota bacterium]|nr:protein kinase [Acidobacteriota bacterium]HMZ80267.1 protein kinase [Acidobacteriota bacterium]HNB71825.1 protein kinase [Acidobacteriota bacterium]HNH81802.1 protein kinase [Acidobacteriota bacterium]HNJ39279.1 protein kinase [Acidobacteriota bacterium]